MYADIEALVLSGELFNGPSRSSSPARSVSPSSDHGWHDDELVNQEDDGEDEKKLPPGVPPQESIGMGPGRTGVKGVIRDRDEAAGLEQQKRAREMEEVRQRMEKGNLGGRTFLEEEREKGLDEKVDELVERERARERERRDVFGGLRQARFGHLREVGVHGFVNAVEKEDRGIWVLVHLYESSLDRCFLLDETLAQLARIHPDTKFLRCRAAALGFASTAPSTSSSHGFSRPPRPSSRRNDDDDLFDEKADDDNSENGDDGDDDAVDLDMLPTLLVYRDGELVHNWVRVDWEAGRAGVEELLEKHNILPRKDSIFGNLGLPSDDEHENDDEFLWGDSDDET
ncbi:hypothetical protein C8J56DRAFT_923996 [Mycena floridula]|nr:hypothetical protein C8J56DRAFT_923996 [Mycena floridula]